MRKLIAITLLAIFGLPFASSLFALTPKSEVSLPACCMRNGKHHCMMSPSERAQFAGSKPTFRLSLSKCPYCPASVLNVGSFGVGIPAASTDNAEMVSRPSTHMQTESKWRIARDRSNNKRGPPFGFSL